MKKKKTEINNEIDDIDPYKVDKLSKIPSWIIILFSKFWAAAAAVFFVLIGGIDLGFDFSSESSDGYQEAAKTMASIILLALFLALIMNYVIKHFAFLMHSRRNNAKKYMLINLKGFPAFILYFLYSLVCSFILFFIVSFFSYKGWIPSLLDNGGAGVEPFSYGFFYVCVDGVFVLLKNIIVNICQRAYYFHKIKEA